MNKINAARILLEFAASNGDVKVDRKPGNMVNPFYTWRLHVA